MRQFIAFTIAAVAISAQAQDTAQAWQFRKDICQTVAKQADLAYRMKQDGKEFPMHVLQDSPSKVLTVWGVQFAQTEATDRRNAIEVAFAKCLDNVDKVYRDDRGGHRTTMDELK